MGFAIIRTAKLKTAGNISASAQHTFRERDTPNADPKRTSQNVHVGAQSTERVLERVNERLATVPTIRKNGVLCVEYLITASPEFFHTSTKADYFKDAQAWLEKVHGKENVVYFGVQLDESTPHAVAYVVPIDERGRLNAAKWLDGKRCLAEMQTNFAQVVGQKHGLERGIEGSKAQHVKVRDYYAAVNKPVPKLPQVDKQLPEPQKPLMAWIPFTGDREWYVSEMQRREQHEAKRQRQILERARAAGPIVKQLTQQAAHARLDRQENKQAGEQLAKMRKSSDLVRDIPLEQVMERLGCEQDPKDKANWKTPAGRISLKGAKFFNHDLGKGGGGAIDLVVHMEGMTPRDAISWLGGAIDKQAAVGAAMAMAKRDALVAVDKPKQLEVPAPVESTWPRVRTWLIEKRQLAAGLVDKLKAVGKVYADRHANAVFLSDSGKSAEIRGTGAEKFAGYRGEKNPFTLIGQGKDLALVESAIDAISLRQLGYQGHITSTAGSAKSMVEKIVAECQQKGITPRAAFDNDDAGRRMAAWVPGGSRLAPPAGKDWNDAVKAEVKRFDQEPEPERQVEQQRNDMSMSM